MRKAIQLRVMLWVEGEDEPAHDFAASTTRAVRDVIRAGATQHPELRIRVREVEEVEE
jgi:hypothetical protein